MKKPKQQNVEQIAKRARITFLDVFICFLNTSITVEITDSIIENSEPNPKASIITKNKTLNKGATFPIRLRPSG